MQELLLLALLLVPHQARAQVAAPPAAPAVASTPVAATIQQPLVALTPDLLKRWGYDVDKVMALPPDRRVELQRQLTMMEAGRLRRIELLKKIKPDSWQTYLDGQQLITPEGMKVIDDYLAAHKDEKLLVPAQVTQFERKDGKPLTAEDFARAQAVMDHLFDGVAAKEGKNLTAGEWTVDAHVRNETVYDMTLTSPKGGVQLSLGQLYVDPNHPNADRSPYGNITWNSDSDPDSWVDYRFKASLGYVDLHSRYFADGPSQGVNQVLQLGSQLGVPQSAMSTASKYLTYDDPYQAHGIIVSSLLTELGRAYNLWGPVDLSWTIGGLVKTMWIAPNAAFDETAGLRVRLADGLSLGFFGGVAQNISPVGNNLVQDGLMNSTIKPGAYIDNSPHAAVALWGKVPGASDLYFSASASQRWSQNVTARAAEGSLMTSFYNHPLTLSAGISDEKGSGIEYGRRKERLELDYQFAENASAFLAAQKDHIMYGNADLDDKSIMAGVKITFGGSHGNSLTVDQLFGGQYKDNSAAKEQFQHALNEVNAGLTAAVDAVDKANQAYDKFRPDASPQAMENALNQLSMALSRLDPAMATSLIEQLGKQGLSPAQVTALSNLWLKTVSANSQYYQQAISQLQAALAKNDPAAIAAAQKALGKVDDWSKWFNEHKNDIRSLIGLLTNQKVWDDAVVAAARAQLIQAMKQFGKVQVPIMGKDFTLQIDAPAILASMGALHSRFSMIAPVTDAQADAWLRKEGGNALGLSGDSFTDQQLSNGLFSLADQQIRSQLNAALAPVWANIGNETSADVASKILAALPPNTAAALQAQYGSNLSGLIPQNLTGQQLKDLVGKLPDQITNFLEKKFGPQLANAIGQSVSWAGDLLSRQVNMMMIQLMLASEELDRLTVDHGRKIDDLDLRMAMRSFDMLDERHKQEARANRADIKDLVVAQAKKDDTAIAEKFTERGKEVLQDLQLDPAWPQGLRVEIADKDWMSILTLYGDGNFFELVDKMKKKYAAKPREGGLTVSFDFDPHQEYGAMIRRDAKNHSIRFTLGRAKDASDAAFKLQHLEDYVAE